MSFSQIKQQYIRHDQSRFFQGDILRDLKIVEWASASENDLEIIERELPYCILMTQDCELEQDFNNRQQDLTVHDKYLQSVLLCPAYPAELVKDGAHMNGVGLNMLKLNRDLYKPIIQNNNARYHFLSSEINLQIPELIVDFKQYFTMPRSELYKLEIKPKYLATLAEIFRESLSQRFTNYFSRIAIPDLVNQ